MITTFNLTGVEFIDNKIHVIDRKTGKVLKSAKNKLKAIFQIITLTEKGKISKGQVGTLITNIKNMETSIPLCPKTFSKVEKRKSKEVIEKMYQKFVA